MLINLGNQPSIQAEDWKNFERPIRFHLGDRDTTVGLEATINICNKIDVAELCVLPDSKHPIKEVKIKLLTASLLDFF
jgi:hypothetical protein